MISLRKLAFLHGWGGGPASIIDFGGFSGLRAPAVEISSLFLAGITLGAGSPGE